MASTRIEGPELRASRILVVGDVMMDILVRPEGPLIAGGDRWARIEARAGGSAANTACWLAAEGAAVLMAGRVGCADHAEHARSLHAHGVAAVLAADPEVPTGTTVTVVSPDGERSFLTDRGANDRLCPADLGDDLLDGTALVHVSGYALFRAGPREAVLGLLDAVRRRSIPLSVDAPSHSVVAAIGAERFLKCIAGAAWLFANEAEAAALSGATEPEAQLAGLAEHAATVVLKRGASGAIAQRGGERFSVAAPATVPQDTTGAGDAFVAGMLAASLGGASMPAGLGRAAALGSAATTILGGRPKPINVYGEGS